MTTIHQTPPANTRQQGGGATAQQPAAAPAGPTAPTAPAPLAYPQGNDVHIGPEQEEHLAHKQGHVTQQRP